MNTALRALTLTALGIQALAPALVAQAQPVEITWSDRWNTRYHRFVDLDNDGTFLGAGEVALQLEPDVDATNPAGAMRTTVEGSDVVNYWVDQFSDKIHRGIDSNADGIVSGAEITTFRDAGLLDGTCKPLSLDITDDGGVWWTSGEALAYQHLGLSRLQDLNADGDAADPGEQILYVDGGAPHVVEHDLGTATIDAWDMGEITAAGNGVLGYITGDHAIYRFEDFNGDGDVTDADESILFLNATGERPDLPMNPDFGTLLPGLQTPAGYPTFIYYMAGVMENGVQTFYFGTTASPFSSSSGQNLVGEALNFLIFKGVDGNGDRDVNDAGEVTLFFDGSADSANNLLLLRELDVLDGGTVYAVGLLPYPALFPGPNGNTWIHRFEDLDGDGDAMDAGEQQLNLFDVQTVGHGPLFPIPPQFGNVMTDPWDFSVRRTSAWTDMGGGALGSNGVPTLVGSGTLAAGTTVGLDVSQAPAGALMLSWLSFSANPTAVVGGTLYATPFSSQLLWSADAAGSLSVSTTWPAGLPQGTDAWIQFVVDDPATFFGLSISNAVKLTTP